MTPGTAPVKLGSVLLSLMPLSDGGPIYKLTRYAGKDSGQTSLPEWHLVIK